MSYHSFFLLSYGRHAWRLIIETRCIASLHSFYLLYRTDAMHRVSTLSHYISNLCLLIHPEGLSPPYYRATPESPLQYLKTCPKSIFIFLCSKHFHALLYINKPADQHQQCIKIQYIDRIQVYTKVKFEQP